MYCYSTMKYEGYEVVYDEVCLQCEGHTSFEGKSIEEEGFLFIMHGGNMEWGRCDGPAIEIACDVTTTAVDMSDKFLWCPEMPGC